MDLVAAVAANGELWINRLNWQRVCTVAPAGEDATVTALAWRPDGRVLACGRRNGALSIVDVESGSARDVPPWASGGNTHSTVTALSWVDGCEGDADVLHGLLCLGDERTRVQVAAPMAGGAGAASASSNSGGSAGEVVGGPDARDDDQPANGLGAGLGDTLDPSARMTVLAVGDADGRVHLLALGTVHVATLDAGSAAQCPGGRVVAVGCSRDLGVVVASVEPAAGDGAIAVFASALCPARRRELYNVAVRRERMRQLVTACRSSLAALKRHWDESLVRLADRFRAFSQQLASNSAGGSEAPTAEGELFALLVDGASSPDLQGFLARDLTEQQLKGAASKLEASCTAVHAVLGGALWRAATGLCVASGDFAGLARWVERYGSVGLTAAAADACAQSALDILRKAEEAIVVLTDVRAGMASFLAWMAYAARFVASGSQDLSAAAMQRPVSGLAAVVRTLAESAGDSGAAPARAHRRVAQYLEDAPLSIPHGHAAGAQGSLAGAVAVAERALESLCAGIPSTVSSTFSVARVVPVLTGLAPADRLAPSLASDPENAARVACCFALGLPACVGVLVVESEPKSGGGGGGGAAPSFGVRPRSLSLHNVVVEFSGGGGTVRAVHMHGSGAVLALVAENASGTGDGGDGDVSLVLAPLPGLHRMATYDTDTKQSGRYPEQWASALPAVAPDADETRARALGGMRGGCARVFASSTRRVALCLPARGRRVRLLDLAEDDEEAGEGEGGDGDSNAARD